MDTEAQELHPITVGKFAEDVKEEGVFRRTPSSEGTQIDYADKLQTSGANAALVINLVYERRRNFFPAIPIPTSANPIRTKVAGSGAYSTSMPVSTTWH